MQTLSPSLITFAALYRLHYFVPFLLVFTLTSLSAESKLNFMLDAAAPLLATDIAEWYADEEGSASRAGG